MDNLVPPSDSDYGPLFASLAIMHQLIPLENPSVVAKEGEIIKFLETLIKTNEPAGKKGKPENWVSNEDLDDEGKAKVSFLFACLFSLVLVCFVSFRFVSFFMFF